jgi:putative phosphoribosyl transferase
MIRRFGNRAEAGRMLGEVLARVYAGRRDVVVLALPRGGVVVGLEVARALGAPLDVFLVRKLGMPGQEELAMGAIASGGVRVMNWNVVRAAGVSAAALDRVVAIEEQELRRREEAYRAGRPPVAVGGRTVVLVDDGLATGATMRAAVAAVRAQRPARIVVAVPTGAADTRTLLAQEADEAVCLLVPEPFYAVGAWYDDFREVTDDGVRAALDAAARMRIDAADGPPSPEAP